MRFASWVPLLLSAASTGATSTFSFTAADASIPIDLSSAYNCKGTSADGRNDGVGIRNGSTFPSLYLPTGQWRHDGVLFAFPDDWGALKRDNVRAASQVISLPEATELAEVHMVVTGEDPGGFNMGETEESLALVFEDGSNQTVHFPVKNWWAHHWTNKGPIRAPFHYLNTTERSYNASHLFHAPVRVPPSAAGKRVVKLALPPANKKWNTAHIFALTVVPAITGKDLSTTNTPEDLVAIAFARATRRWVDLEDGTRAQVVEVGVRNPLSVTLHGDSKSWVTQVITIDIRGKTVKTVTPGRIQRLTPGDEVVVEVLVTPTGTSSSFNGAQVELSIGSWSTTRPVVVEGASLVHDFAAWTEDESDLEQHTSPQWFNDAKFGIFIHWGLFSVPAWAPPGLYAEWYDFWLHDEDETGPAYRHHLETYGPDFVYDDFIPQFTGSAFNASEWVKLFSDAGAKYFVFTTKHHDGYALFDTGETSHRNSLRLGPKRDFLRELMSAAKKEQPHLKRATYFSMPEWYSPLYAEHGRLSFPGGQAHNPYKPEELEPYTGFVDVKDYIEGVQLPQMRILANEYETDLMWCDIGLDNHSSAFAAEWFASSARQGRQVAMDNRCGIGGDMETPEMTKFNTVQMATKWETCASMDPFSFGYNADTRDDQYRNATDIIHSLIDITAHGGNFLLNIGPKADGSIIDAVARPLREAGEWLKRNGRAVYGTTPFPLVPEVVTETVHVQTTRTPYALYLISLRDPGRSLVIPAPLPVMAEDTISLLTRQGDVRVPWTYEGGVLTISLEGVDVRDITGDIAYVFEVQYESRRDKGSVDKHHDEL